MFGYDPSLALPGLFTHIPISEKSPAGKPSRAFLRVLIVIIQQQERCLLAYGKYDLFLQT